MKETKLQLFLIVLIFRFFEVFLLLFPGLKGSLQRLQLEYVDVVFANRPDSNTPMEGEWRNVIKDSRVTDSSLTTYSTHSRKWNIFRLIWLNMKDKNLSSRCLSASIFTHKVSAPHLASSLIFEQLQAPGVWLLPLQCSLSPGSFHFCDFIN